MISTTKYCKLNNRTRNSFVTFQIFQPIPPFFSHLGRKTLDEGHRATKLGGTTDEIDQAVHRYVIDNGAYPSPLNYYNFRKSLCT